MISFSRFGCFGLGLVFGCIARLIFIAGDGVTTRVCVDVSTTEVEVVVDVNEAAAATEAPVTRGVKRVLGGFLEGEGVFDERA